MSAVACFVYKCTCSHIFHWLRSHHEIQLGIMYMCLGALIYTALVMHCVMCGSGHRWRQQISVPK